MKKEGKYKHGLKAPENYFESFEDRLFGKMAEEALPEKPGFRVPEDYFDGLETKILSKLARETTVPVIPLYKRKSFMYAASIAASLVLAFFIFKGEPNQEVILDIADIEAYLEGDGLDFDTYDVAQLLNEEDLENLSLETIFSEENLEAYLLENLDDNTLLIE
jgi:hypothetical protein